MNDSRLVPVYRALLLVALAAAGWSIAVILTGGFGVNLGPVRLTSHNPRTSVLIALICGLVLAGHPVGRAVLRSLWSRCNRLLRAAGPLVPVGVALAGIGASVYQWAGAPPLWLDEEMIAINLRDRSLTALAGPLWLGQAAPFAWLAVERALVLLVGTGERTLRLVPLLFGIGTVALALWVGRRWMGWVGTAALVVLCTISRSLWHFRFEIKPYTGDAFWALLLPALVAWALEGRDRETRGRRLRIWWGAAAVGHWFAHGALLVVPALALLITGMTWRRDGRRAMVAFSLVGLVWLASFGLHYQLSLGATNNSQFLRNYWSEQVPAASLGPTARAAWLVDRLGPLAHDPGGTALSLSLWLSAAFGFAFGGRPALGAAFALVPLSAFVLAGLRLVPLYERFSLWMVPALYVGVAMLIDRAVEASREFWHRPAWRRLAPAIVAVGVLWAEYRLCADVYRRGLEIVEIPSPGHKHRLDDRAAVRWLVQHRRPGDAVMTTRLGWPAVWWYGEIPPPDENGVGSRLPDGTTLYEMTHLPPGPDCQMERVSDLLADHRRILVHLGFPDVPDGFAELLVQHLERTGTIAAAATFADHSLALVVDRDVPAASGVRVPSLRPEGEAIPHLEGCVRVQPARGW